MRLLLDTHALVWWLGDDPGLSSAARDLIADVGNDIRISAASAMEVATKYRLGKLPEAAALAQDFEEVVRAEGFAAHAITVRQAVYAGTMPIAHKDPFDRFLIAQSILDDLPLVSNERLFDGFGVKRLW